MSELNLSCSTEPLSDSVETNISYDSNQASSITPNVGEMEIEFCNKSNLDNMEKFLKCFTTKVNAATTNEKQKNDYFNMCSELIEEYSSFIKHLNKEDSNIFDNIDLAQNFVVERLRQNDSAQKRQIQIEAAPGYVEPREFALGTRWEMKKQKDGSSVPQLIDSKYQYISIIKTLHALFKNQHFRNVYVEYNKVGSILRPKSIAGAYVDFRCGLVFKTNELYQKYPDSLQLKIMTDDFTVANPLGPRSSTHKLCGMYFLIENLPNEYLSRVDNIFVICLAHSNDLKTKETDFNDLWRVVLEEISLLENTGIEIGDGITIRGTISRLSGDNAGLSQYMCFAESSQATYFCRICKMTKSECRGMCVEDRTLYRTLEDYESCLKMIENSTKVDFKQTFGIKRYCLLNDLKYFNIFKNKSVDPMHDLNEGVVPFLLKHFFSLLISLKILNENALQQKFLFFDYGDLQTKNKPSLIDLKKGTLDQTGSQIMCLFRHCPYILYEYREHDKLKSAWKCILSLLRICQIVYSTRVTDADIEMLNENVAEHLQLIREVFNLDFINKHHILTHYGSLISEMGPLIHMSMMRGESKHQDLKRIISSNRNFVNITKTIMKKHQERLALKSNTFLDEIKMGKRIRETEFSEEDATLVEVFFDPSNCIQLNWLQINGLPYKQKLFVLKDKTFYRIEGIFYDDSKYFFLCVAWKSEEFDYFLNSMRIKESEPIVKVVLPYLGLDNKKSFEAKRFNCSHYIIAENLDVSDYGGN